MSKKIINIYIDSFKFGGIEKNLVSILNALDREKYLINMIFLNNAIGDMFYQVEIPLNTILLNPNELSWKKLVVFSNFIKFLPKRIFRKLYRIPDADVEIIFPERLVPIFANKLTAECKCSWNQTFVNPAERLEYFSKSFKTRLIQWWGRYSYKKLDYVICNSMMCKAQYEAIWEGISNAIAIPGYANSDTICRAAEMVPPEDITNYTGKKIVFVGRLAWEKNIDLLIDTVKFMSQKSKIPFRCFVIGDGPERKKCDIFSEDNSNLLTLGYMDNPYCVIKNCDCLVSTSRYEGFGLTAVESMLCGCPVASVDNGGISEILDGGRYGVLTAQNPEELANGILELLSDDQKQKELIQKGYQRAFEYDIKNAIKKIEYIFQGGK